MTKVAQLFREHRVELGLSPKKLAVRAGYTNLTKGMRRVLETEDIGCQSSPVKVMTRFAELLAITPEQLSDALSADEQSRREETERRAAQYPPALAFRAGPVAAARTLAPEMSYEDAYAEGKRVANELGRDVWLQFDLRRGELIEPD